MTETMKLRDVLELPVHEYAAKFPLLDDAALTNLAQDIEASGQQAPVVLYQGTILDGRNRLAAMSQTKLDEVLVTQYEGDDPLRYVFSINVHRRHLTPMQLVEVGHAFKPEVEAQAKARQGTRTDLTSGSADSEVGRTADLVADLLQGAVSAKTLSRGWRVIEDAPDLWEETKRTGGGVNTAYTKLTAPPKESDRVLTRTTDPRTGQVENVMVKREAMFYDLLEKAADALVDAKALADKYRAQAGEEDLAASKRLAGRISAMSLSIEDIL